MGRPQFYNAVESRAEAAAREIGDQYTRFTDNVAADSSGGGSVRLDGDEAPAESRTYTDFTAAYRDGNVPSDPLNVVVLITFYSGVEGEPIPNDARRTVALNPGANCGKVFDPQVRVDEYDEINVKIYNNDPNPVELSVDLSYFSEQS